MKTPLKTALLLSSLLIPQISRAATVKEIRAAAAPVLKIVSRSKTTNSGAKTTILVNSVPVNFQRAALYDSKGELLVPLRPLCQAMGTSLSFAPQSRDAIIQRGNQTLRLSTITLGGNTIAPLKLLCDSLGASVKTQKGKINVVSITLASTAAPKTPPTAIDEMVQYNLTQLNSYRTRAGVPLLKLDDKLNAFALAGSAELQKNHIPHHHFENADIWNSGFEGGAAENQGDPNGWRPGETTKAIDEILLMMFNEGPGGGHHDNMLNPKFKRVGVGLITDKDGRLYLTNDFSE